jgi:nitrite reductase (NADH) large subunit
VSTTDSGAGPAEHPGEPATATGTIAQAVVEVRQPGGAPWRLAVSGTLVVGREGGGCVVADVKVSRRHLLLEATAAGLTVTELGSRNGTWLNERRLIGTAPLAPGDELRLGDTEITVLRAPSVSSPALITRGRGTLRATRPEAPTAWYAVEIAEPGREVRRVVVDRVIDLGRENVSVAVADPGVSRRHLRLSPEADGLVVTDLGSRNGTFVNAVKITGSTRLAAGDVVTLAGTTIIVAPPDGDTRPPAGGAVTAPRKPAPAAVPEPVALPAVPEPVAPPAVHRPRRPAFPNVTQLRSLLPVAVWHGMRAVSVAAFLGLCVALFVRPAGGLFVFWRVVVPVLPLLFFVAPGLWRNICPLAAANQVPRLFGFSRARKAPGWLRARGHLVAVLLFVVIVATRKVLFNGNGPTLAVLLLGVIASAFTGGVLLAGKSGWCSSICPLLPVQRLYGQTPFVLVPNTHCRPCVGCTKNCYDFNPRVAYQADMRDPEAEWSGSRKLFAGAFPGLIVAFFTVPNPPAIPIYEMYLQFGLYLLASAGSFFVLDALVRGPAARLAAVYGAAALNLFYFYQAGPIAGAVAQVTGLDVGFLRWPLRAAVLAVSSVWIWRTFRAERRFVEQAAALPPLRLSPTQTGRLSGATAGDGRVAVHFTPNDRRVVAAPGRTLLEIAEADNLPIEAGCRMGVCGADPVAVLHGADRLSPIGEDEANTLRRLGLASNTRMACCAQVHGDVSVSLTPDRSQAGADAAGSGAADVDPSIRSVVVIGNGIAGVTAAEFVRRRHPDCELHVVGQEIHPLYNRIGICRLIYGRSAMQGLYLQPEAWYEQRHITCWLNTRARRVDVAERRVVLGTGESLGFDRLILAMGSSSVVPPIRGFGMPGSFVLREAGDALGIRSYAQRHGARSAVVAGGGLLGLEAAHALQQFGLGVTVLERSPRLLRKQVDERCSELLAGYFSDLGIEIVRVAEVAAVEGAERVEQALLLDGRALRCDLLLVCAGIRPNAELARDAGIEVGHGVLVDEHMRTSAPGVFAAGDVAESDGQVVGLWPTAVAQAEVAAVNATGGDQRFAHAKRAVILKGVGLDLAVAGRIEPIPGDEVIVVSGAGRYEYAKLVVAAGELVGGLVLGRSADVPRLLAAVRGRASVGDRMSALRAGDLAVLTGRTAVAAAT